MVATLTPKSAPVSTSYDWCVRAERWLLGTFLLSTLWFFLGQLGVTVGFDAGAHLEMLNLLSFREPALDLHRSFYAYHPPLAFLLAHSLYLLGLSPVSSVQIVSMTATLVAFASLRSTLRYLNLLRRPVAVAFLYLVFTIPMALHLSMSINLDTIIVALDCLALALSIRLLWPTASGEPLTGLHRTTLVVELITVLVAAMFTKFSGILVFVIPMLVAMVKPREEQRHCSLTKACAIAIVALVLVFPYYLTRYKIPTGTFFPNNGDWMVGDALAAARQERSADTLHFFFRLFSPAPVHASEGLTKRDYGVMRLSDTWRDFWIKDSYLGPTTPFAESLGRIEMQVAPWLIMIGLLMCLRRVRRWSPWDRFGWILIALSLLQVFALIAYLYTNPFAGWGPTKGIYIAPALLGLAYLLAQAIINIHTVFPRALRHHGIVVQKGILLGIGVLMIVHHLIPLY